MRILLCGFMGSGKTTLFKRVLKNSQEIKCIDLDDLLESKLCERGENLAGAIDRVGWDHFRELEKSLLNEILSLTGHLLIALGGGSLNQELLTRIGPDPKIQLVWLNTSFEVCWERIANDDTRPLVAKRKKKLLDLYKEREDLYSKALSHLNLEQQTKISCFEDLIKD